MYFTFNEDKFENYNAKPLFATSFLRDGALDQIEIYLNNFYKNKATDRSINVTKTLFKTQEGFKIELKRIFRDFDAKKIAIRKIIKLK